MFFRSLFAVVILSLAACSQPGTQHVFSGQTMGTTYNVTVVDETNSLDREAIDKAISDTLVAVNASYSNWDPESEISRLNAADTTEPVKISDGLAQMLSTSNRIHSATDGKFDLTLKPLVEIWGFGPSGEITKRPTSEEIEAAREFVGQTRVLDLNDAESTLRKLNGRETIDLSSIAKGFGIDEVALTLERYGAERFLVEIGGDIYAKGQSLRGADWRIGIEQPIAGQRKIEATVSVSNVGMATSGDYRNFFEQDGVRFSHIIDAETGRPITHDTASVTVIAETAAEADAWATALLAVGAEAGQSIAEANGVAALFIVRDRSIDSDGFSSRPNTLFLDYQDQFED